MLRPLGPFEFPFLVWGGLHPLSLLLLQEAPRRSLAKPPSSLRCVCGTWPAQSNAPPATAAVLALSAMSSTPGMNHAGLCPAGVAQTLGCSIPAAHFVQCSWLWSCCPGYLLPCKQSPQTKKLHTVAIFILLINLQIGRAQQDNHCST